MAFLTDKELNDGQDHRTLAPGKSANVVLTKYTPFNYGPNKEKTMPRYEAKDAETGASYEFVGYSFHQCVKDLNDSIVPEHTVIRVECLDNGSRYPDFSLTVVVGAEAKKEEEAPF